MCDICDWFDWSPLIMLIEQKLRQQIITITFITHQLLFQCNKHTEHVLSSHGLTNVFF